MKKIISFFLFILLLTNCSKDDDTANVNINKLTTFPGWTTINFKTNYTIQVPEGFEGVGMTGFEGNMFFKSSKDNKIVLSYSYCGPLFCNDFGDTLSNQIPKSVQVMGDFDMLITLSKIEYFCQNSETVGILYYSNNGDITKGRLYWKDNGTLKQALELQFYISEIQTVRGVAESIKRK
jgi:hypothetical protein